MRTILGFFYVTLKEARRKADLLNKLYRSRGFIVVGQGKRWVVIDRRQLE